MRTSPQREWAIDILEAAPSIIFLALWRAGLDMQLAGWTGAALAAIQLIGFYRFRIPDNPLMLGINVHLLIITPLIMASLAIGAREFSDALVVHSYRCVLVTVFVVGCALTLSSRRGFIGVDGLSKAGRWRKSAILLVASAVAVLWAFFNTGSASFAVALPMIGLFALRRFLIARTLDNSTRLSVIVAVGGGSSFLAGTEQVERI
jgi:hypothetical protein